MAGDSKEAVERMAERLIGLAIDDAGGRSVDLQDCAAMLLRLLAQRDAADRAEFERGVREAAAVAQGIEDLWARTNGARSGAAMVVKEHILALLAPAAIDEGTQR